MFPAFWNRHKYNVKQACIDAGFELSTEFLNASNEEITATWNGIGAAGKWYNWLIPKTAYWLNINLPSCPHDFGYKVGQTKEYKIAEDIRYKKNNAIWVRKYTKNKKLLALRLRRVRKYYWIVKHFGSKAFWKGKNKNEQK